MPALPPHSADGECGVSRCYVSEVDKYKKMQIEGWAYTNKEYFNGEECGTYLIVKQNATGNWRAYLTVNEEGVSGIDHIGAICKNPSASDWVAYIDVSEYHEGIYSLGLLLYYKNEGKDAYSFYVLDEKQSFAVSDGEVIMPVSPTIQ